MPPKLGHEWDIRHSLFLVRPARNAFGQIRDSTSMFIPARHRTRYTQICEIQALVLRPALPAKRSEADGRERCGQERNELKSTTLGGRDHFLAANN